MSAIGSSRRPRARHNCGSRRLRNLMHIAIVTAQGFNELDSFIALGILNRVKRNAWRVSTCAPSETVTSMNGVTVHAQSRLADAASADVVLFGSGTRTREFVAD